MAKVTVREALMNVVKNPEPRTDILIDVPASELVARTLFEIANNPDTRVRGSLARSHRAQNIIMNRTTGSRKAGTHPATRRRGGIEFLDLTKGQLP